MVKSQVSLFSRNITATPTTISKGKPADYASPTTNQTTQGENHPTCPVPPPVNEAKKMRFHNFAGYHHACRYGSVQAETKCANTTMANCSLH
mmetsp:Transcript_30663/g.70657  ORF Transcript_30663/g.70657 Transcript_30663/m.70657 type:complete len:92 (-) Transcript_30663:1850-2125(-)